MTAGQCRLVRLSRIAQRCILEIEAMSQKRQVTLEDAQKQLAAIARYDEAAQLDLNGEETWREKAVTGWQRAGWIS